MARSSTATAYRYRTNLSSPYARQDSTRRQRRKNSKLILGLSILWGLSYGLWLGYFKLPWFDVSEIKLEGIKQLDATELKQQALISGPMRIFNVDEDQIKHNLTRNPMVKQALVSISMPNGIRVRIDERQIFAQINIVGTNHCFSIDEEGVILKDMGSQSLAGFPSITGVDLSNVTPGKIYQDPGLSTGLSILHALKEAKWLNKIAEVNVLDLQCPMLYTRKGKIEVRLGQTDYVAKITKLQTLWQNLNARIQELDYIDLRFEDMAVVRFREQKV